jgi:hypothetical protein
MGILSAAGPKAVLFEDLFTDAARSFGKADISPASRDRRRLDGNLLNLYAGNAVHSIPSAFVTSVSDAVRAQGPAGRVRGLTWL